MKKQRISIPFILPKNKDLKEINNFDEKKANYLILEKHKNFEISNKNLYKNFGIMMNRDIYTLKRYDLNYSGDAFDLFWAEKKLKTILKIQRDFLNDYSENLKIDVKSKFLLSNNKSKAHSSFMGKLPPKLNLSLINELPTNYQEFDELSVVDTNILGQTKEVVIFDDYSSSGIKLEDLFKRGLRKSDIRINSDGKYLIDKSLFLQLAKVPKIKEKLYFGSTDLEWTLPNYKSVIDESGKSIFFKSRNLNKI